jgi:hypothetical protein
VRADAIDGPLTDVFVPGIVGAAPTDRDGRRTGGFLMHVVVSGLVAVGLGLAAQPASPQSAGAPMMTLGDVLVWHTPDVVPGTDAAAFEAAVRDRVLPALRASAAAPVHLVRADRGGRKGQYAVVSTTAAPDRPPTTDPRAADFAAGVAKLLAPFTKGPGRTIRYSVVGPGTAGPSPAVDVLGMHYVKVRPERRDAFERFVTATVHPAVANLRPDLRVIYYRVEGGATADYVALFALTRASRDRYWPGGSDSDALRAAFGPVRALTKELAAYLVEGSFLADEKFAAAVYESRDWSDFVLVP